MCASVGGGSERQLTNVLETGGDRDKEETRAVSEGWKAGIKAVPGPAVGEREAQSPPQRAALGQKGTEPGETVEQKNEGVGEGCSETQGFAQNHGRGGNSTCSERRACLSTSACVCMCLCRCTRMCVRVHVHVHTGHVDSCMCVVSVGTHASVHVAGEDVRVCVSQAHVCACRAGGDMRVCLCGHSCVCAWDRWTHACVSLWHTRLFA